MTAIRFIWKCGLGKFYPQPISLNEIQLSSVLPGWIYNKSNKKSTIYRCLDTWVNNISFRPETSYFKSPIATEHYPLLFQLYQADRLQLRFTKEDQYHEEVTQLLNNLSCFFKLLENDVGPFLRRLLVISSGLVQSPKRRQPECCSFSTCISNKLLKIIFLSRKFVYGIQCNHSFNHLVNCVNSFES